MNQNETNFEDAESYSYSFNKDKLTFKDIILQHLKKISQFASVEFRGGYWEIKEVPFSSGSGVVHSISNKVYVPDSREVYSNAVECLADMLYPYFDEEMKKAEQKCKKELEEAYNSNTILVEPERADEDEEQEKAYIRKFKNQSDKLSYRSERVKINRKLFRALCSFLYRKKYLELGSIED